MRHDDCTTAWCYANDDDFSHSTARKLDAAIKRDEKAREKIIKRLQAASKDASTVFATIEHLNMEIANIRDEADELQLDIGDLDAIATMYDDLFQPANDAEDAIKAALKAAKED